MSKRKSVLLSGLLAFALCGLFPPWLYIRRARDGNIEDRAGYHFIFTPPDRYEAVVTTAVGNATQQKADSAKRLHASLQSSTGTAKKGYSYTITAPDGRKFDVDIDHEPTAADWAELEKGLAEASPVPKSTFRGHAVQINIQVLLVEWLCVGAATTGLWFAMGSGKRRETPTG